jgi:hypothetical protein
VGPALTLSLLLALQAGGARVVLDLSALDDDGYAKLGGPRLAEQATLRLAEEGFVVVPPDAPHELTLLVTRSVGGVRLAVISASGIEKRDVVVSDDPLPEVQLEISQKLVELARAVPTQPPAPEVPAVAAVVPQDLPAPSAPPRLNGMALSVGVALRPGGADPQLGVGLSHRFGRLDFYLALTGTLANSPAISAFEAQLAAGVGLTAQLTRTLSLRPRVLVGGLAHIYSPNGGLRGDITLTVPVSLALALSDQLALEATVASGLASSARVHSQGSEQLWYRGAVRLDASVGFAWAF